MCVSRFLTKRVRTYFGYLAVGTNDVVVRFLDDFIVDFLDGKAEVAASVIYIDGSECGLVYARRGNDPREGDCSASDEN